MSVVGMDLLAEAPAKTKAATTKRDRSSKTSSMSSNNSTSSSEGQDRKVIRPDPPNINLMNLCLEILDNEHDLDRANGETNPLYIYCDKHLKDTTLAYTFMRNTYISVNISNPMNPKQILIKMKDIVNARNAGSFTFTPAGTPANASTTTITYNYEESIESFGKDFDNLREWIKNNNRQIGRCLAETYRGVRANPTNKNNPKLVNVYRSALTTQFDNQCSWGEESVLLQNTSVIGRVGDLSSNRIYDNYFPKAASVFVYGSELKGAAAAAAIIRLILNNSTSVFPFTEAEYEPMRGELSAFISYILKQQMVDGQKWIKDGELYLLHIFKVFNTSTGKTGGGSPQYSFSLQKGQVELNEVSTELYGYNKRGSKLCNILCASGQTPTSTIGDKMLFSEKIPFHMKNCHISYGKLCGDGVTIFAAKKAKFTGTGYNAVISIDEFCCLRAVYAGIIVAYQQKPSAMAATGLGSLSTNRNHGIYQVGNIKLSAAEAASAETKQAADLATAAATAAKTTAIDNLNNIISVITKTGPGQFKPVPMIMFDKLFLQNPLNQVTPNNKTTTQINEMVDFCVQYSNILINLNLSGVQVSGGQRTTRGDNDIMDKLGGLGTLELLLEQFGVSRDISRPHIVYIMITQLFTNKSFTEHINSFIVKLFDVNYNNGDIKRLPTRLRRDIQINEGLVTKYYADPPLIFDEFFPKNLKGVYDKTSYKTIYDNMQTIYNIFNQYNCDDDLSDGKINEAQCKFKHMLRQRLVIFKYIYRAYTTCCWAITPIQASGHISPPKQRLNISNTSIGVASALGAEYKEWGDISKYVNGGTMTPENFTTAYNAMLTDTPKSLESNAKSPVKKELKSSDKEDEDKLGEVILDDDYKQGSTDTSCETPPCASVCAQNISTSARPPAGLTTEELDKGNRGILSGFLPLVSFLDARRRPVYPREEDSMYHKVGKGGSRKRNPSKIPRRTIRRRAPRRSQKRTIRRQRRNKKGTQKRRK